MKLQISSMALALAPVQLIAGELTKCTFEYTCAKTRPCQTTKTGDGVDFADEKLPGNQLRIDLGDDGLPLLNVVQVSDDLTTAYGWSEDRSASYTFSAFSDGIVAYTTHVFTGIGISLTALGRCEVKN
ncbi:hypothetical protein [uncultured Ruegeria sp.]|uniref:hypothetical protein n=1 Tax=uncultured Ruegeria sp. TaxID=259304 RepID=UPI00262847C3|nr:hypothetical protein [uncultured Ruegeria sp.]